MYIWLKIRCTPDMFSGKRARSVLRNMEELGIEFVAVRFRGYGPMAS